MSNPSEPQPEELLPLTTAVLATAAVARPGDLLVVAAKELPDLAQLDRMSTRFREHAPDLRVMFVEAEALVVYRDEHLADGAAAADGQEAGHP